MTSLELKRVCSDFQVRAIKISNVSPIVIDELQEALGVPYEIAIKVILKY